MSKVINIADKRIEKSLKSINESFEKLKEAEEQRNTVHSCACGNIQFFIKLDCIECTQCFATYQIP